MGFQKFVPSSITEKQNESRFFNVKPIAIVQVNSNSFLDSLLMFVEILNFNNLLASLYRITNAKDTIDEEIIKFEVIL